MKLLTKRTILAFDPHFPYKQKLVTNFKAVKLLEPIFINGKQVYKSPSLGEIRKFAGRAI